MKVEVVETPNEIGGGDPFLIGSMAHTPPISTSGSTASISPVSVSNLQVQPRASTLASELTDVWNNGAKPTPQTPQAQVQVNACRQNIKITCLFCCNLMFQRIQPDLEDDEMKANRNRRLQNLCDKLHLNKDEIPDSCSKEMFPFCKGCRENVDKLWEITEELKKLQGNLVATVKDIQRKVADGELLEPRMKQRPMHPLVVEAEAKKFTRLRDMILEAYREALWINVSQQHERFNEKFPPRGNVRVAEPMRAILPPVPTANTIPQTLTRAPRADYENRPGPSSSTVEPPPQVAGPSFASTPKRSKRNTKKMPVKESSSTNREALATGGRGTLKRKQAANTPSSSMMMPNIVLTPIDAQILMNMKRETAAAALQAEQESFEWDSDDEDIFTVAVRKRRQLYEGVQIFRCENPTKKEYLQCSACSFTIQITKKYVKGNTPYQKMKAHIDYIHREKVTDAEAENKKNGIPRPVFECDFCAETFTTQESFLAHNTTHPEHQIPAQECDICGRPIKFNSASNTNLLRHKFTHKSDAERQAALEAGERVGNYAFLENRDEKKPKRLSTFSNRRKSAGVRVGKKRDRVDRIPYGNFECTICSRRFPLKNGLALHMKSHAMKSGMSMNKVRVPTPPPSSTGDVEVLKVKRLKKKAKNEKPPALFPEITPTTVKAAEIGTQTTPKKTSKENEQVREDGEGAEEPGTASAEMRQEQQEDNDGVLPILKREVLEEDRMETDD